MHIFLNRADSQTVYVSLKWRRRRKHILPTFYDPNFRGKVLAFLYYLNRAEKLYHKVDTYVIYWYTNL